MYNTTGNKPGIGAFRLIWPILILFWGVLQQPVLASDVSVSAALSTASLSLDSTAFLTVTVHGARTAEIDIPDVENIAIHRRGQSSKMQVINGEISSSITYTYVVQPLAEGSYTIPSLNIRVKNQLLTTDQIALQVVAENANPVKGPDGSPAKDSEKLAFITMDGLTNKAYSGQILPIEIHAYFRRGIRVELQKLPTIIGEAFVLSPLSNEPRQTVETVNGTAYSVISWYSTISPIKEGNHELIVNLDATLLLPQKNTRSQRRPRLFGDDFFDDDYFDGFFGGIEKKNIRLRTDKQVMDIRPLPEEGKPTDFSGAIGDFSINVTAKPLKIEVGDPITLTMIISGKGNFDRVSVPLSTNSPDWKIYSPSSRFESSGNDYEGKKIFDQAIVAKNAAVDAIPQIRFSYFDPLKERYITKTTESLPLLVLQGEVQQEKPAKLQQTSQAQTSAGSDNISANQPAMPLQLSTGDFVAEILPMYQRFWFLLTTLFTTIVLIGVLSAFAVKGYRSKNKDLINKRKLRKQLVFKLSALQKSMADKDVDTFVTVLRETIQKQLSFVWCVEASAITRNDLQKKLPVNSPLIQIFVVAEEYAYGKADLAPEDMEQYYEILKKEMEKEL